MVGSRNIVDFGDDVVVLKVPEIVVVEAANRYLQTLLARTAQVQSLMLDLYTVPTP